MLKKLSFKWKALSISLALLMILQTAHIATVALDDDVGDSQSSTNLQSSVIPDADNGQWEIPEATENKNNVNMTINNGIVYTTEVYNKLKDWGYITGYQRAQDPYRKWASGGYSGYYYMEYTASLGPTRQLSDYKWYNNVNGNWIKNQYVTTYVTKKDGQYGIYPSLLTPTLVLGDHHLNIERGYISGSDIMTMASYSKANLNQATLRISATTGGDAYIQYLRGDRNDAAVSKFTKTGSSRILADINLMEHYKLYGGFPRVYLTANGYPQSLTEINVAFIDNTSPSIQNVEVAQENGQLVVKLVTNEGVRWAADSVKDDLNDIWIELELQVVGTDYTQKVKAYVSGIEYQYDLNQVKPEKTDYSNKIVFKADLGPFANLDYKVVDISGVGVPKKDYAITFGKMLMCANQLKDYRIRNQTLARWDSEKEVTVYETYNTTAICDIAGNALNLEAIVNWPINEKEIKNNATFVRKIELMNSKILLGGDMSKAEDFAEDISRADYFFGPNDEIAPRLYLNRVLTEEEVATFKVTANVKDSSGEYITLTPKGTGNYYIGKEEFMYIDFEPIILTQSMSADAQDGTKAYFEITKVECELTTSPHFTNAIPSPEKTLYIDMTPPEVQVKSNSLEEPAASGGYYKLDIEVSITDALVDGMLQSGMLEQTAYFYISGNVNEATPFKYLVNTSAAAPSNPNDYTGEGTLTVGGKVKLGNKGAGMTTVSGNKAYIHLLIPEKSNLLLNDFKVYADVTDMVGNMVDVNHGYDVTYRIDHQRPDVIFTSSSTVFTSDSAITTVKVEATDYNNIESVSYQWVDAGQSYDDGKWESAVIDPDTKVTATITKQFDGTKNASYDVMLFVKCRDNRGNESLVIQRNEKVNIDKPTTSYEVNSDLSSPSTYPEITVKGPETSSPDKKGYTRVTVSPLNPKDDWMYVTVLKSGEEIDLFDFEGQKGVQWYKVVMSGARYYSIEEVDGEVVTLDSLKKYYGNVKISFENAYMDLTPRIGYVDDTVTDGSYIADQNFLTVRFASQNDELSGVNAIDFLSVTNKDGERLSAVGNKGENSLFFSTDLRGVNSMRGVTFYFDIRNIRMDDWGLLDIDFENSTVELLRSDKDTEEELVYLQVGLANSESQYFQIPAYTEDGGWFETGVYKVRVTVKSRSGSTDVAESLNIVYDAGTPSGDGVVSYSFDLRYENGAYRKMSSDKLVDSFGIAVQPGREVSRNNVFAVYSGGVTGFSFTLGADNTLAQYDGFTVGEVEGFRYWNSLSSPTAEDLEGYAFTRYERAEDPCLVVTSGVESIYTEQTIPKGAEGLGNIYLVEGVNVICYQVKMANGYVSPVKQFTIIVTQYIPEFNVIVSDYTPSYYAAQRDGQVNAHDITMKIEEAFSLNGSGNVNVEIWSNYAMSVNDEWVEQTDENSHTLSLTLLTDHLSVGDTATLTKDSYTSCFPPYSGQGNQCSAVFVAIDEYGGMVVYAPQIGAASRLNDPEDPYDDLITIEYYGSYQDDPFVIGRDLSFIEIYNDAVYFGNELVGFQNLRSENGGEYVVVETSIPELQYNLFAIQSNNVEFTAPHSPGYAGDHKTISANWSITKEKLINYDLIDWDNTTITFTDASGYVLAEGLNLWNPGTNDAGFIGASYGEIYYPYTGEREMQFALDFANPVSVVGHPAYNWGVNEWDEENVNSVRSISFKINGVNLLGDEFETEGTINLRYINYNSVSYKMTESGIVLELPFISEDYSDEIYTGVFNGYGYNFMYDVTDVYGNKHTVSGVCTLPDFDTGTDITFSSYNKTSKPVVITLNRDDGANIYVDVIDADIISVEGNGTSFVKVTVTDCLKFGYKYIDKDGQEVVKSLTVSNIVKPNPEIKVDVNTDIVLVDDDGVRYRYGNVTVTLIDDNFTLTDIYTGKTPTFTFVPGGDSSYTFRVEDIIATLGDEEAISIPKSLTYTIDFELREIIDPLAEVVSSDAPSVKISAFKEDRGYYENANLALILEPTGIEDSIVEGDGITYKYAGKRVNASAFLRELGWGSGYRFLVEVAFGGAYKTFIKEGIYTDAPDYETGVSDTVEGVTLNSRLITVESNAQFTFFVVAKNGNYTSVVFDVTDIGNAPTPTTLKVPTEDGKSVKVYILQPNGASDFSVTPADLNITVNTEEAGDYAGIPYVEYGKNDEYLINYTFTFNGETVNGQINTSIYEIAIREMKQDGVISWSANKTLEATDKTVSATLSFSEVINGVDIIGDVDESKVDISYFGRQVKIKFTENHSGFTLKIKSSYGDVTVTVDGVNNIDREAPIVWETQRVVSQDGKKVTVTIATSERTVFREGGYIGVQATDENGKEIYVYTREFTENGSYTYHFTDMSGIESVITVNINEIVDEELEVFFSKDKNTENAVTDASSLVLNSGDKVYVTVNQNATVSYNGGEGVAVNKGEWLEITLDDGAEGTSPYVTVTDDYGRVAIRQFSQIIARDLEAPIVATQKAVVTVSAGTDREEIEKLLLDNVSATDRDGNLTYIVEFTDNISVSGVTSVTYKVSDSSGNVATAECKLRITSGEEPKVTIGGSLIERDGSYYAEGGEELVITVDVGGQPYCVYMESGIKTVAQMKIGSTDITDGYVDTTEVNVGVLESGYYTIIVQTQSRDYFRIIIYVY